MSDPHNHAWTQDHVYLSAGHDRAEARTRLVVYFTAAFMLIETVAGLVFGSMALLADGVHMATHVGALGLAAWAYWMARRHARNRQFSFGSGKFGDLAGFSSALVLGIISLAIAADSIVRLYSPVAIHYLEAMVVAALGLGVNIISAVALAEDGHDHCNPAHHHDYNLRAAYVHVLADAATSVFALIALAAGLLFGWRFLDPVVGLAGAFVIGRWSVLLMQQSGRVLLDVEDDPMLANDIRKTLEQDLRAQISDMHLWRLGPGHRGLIVSVVSPVPRSADEIKHEIRRRHSGLSHVTVEISVCSDCPSAGQAV
jgi:cation diffusion facilitator family transporter